MSQNQLTYNRLNVTPDPRRRDGRKPHNPMLPGIVADLKAKHLAVGERRRNGRIPLMSTKTRKANRWAWIIQKRMAANLHHHRYRLCGSTVTKRCMPTGRAVSHRLRQHQHLMQAWTIVRKAGYVPDCVRWNTTLA